MSSLSLGENGVAGQECPAYRIPGIPVFFTARRSENSVASLFSYAEDHGICPWTFKKLFLIQGQATKKG
jgi:hypothetical protein